MSTLLAADGGTNTITTSAMPPHITLMCKPYAAGVTMPVRA